jgi:hypothetical protein
MGEYADHFLGKQAENSEVRKTEKILQ